MREYMPAQFARVRLFKIDSKAYREALFYDESDDLPDPLRVCARAKFSEGKSGAFMWYSKDRRLLVKTMEIEECLLLCGHFLHGKQKSARRHADDKKDDPVPLDLPNSGWLPRAPQSYRLDRRTSFQRFTAATRSRSTNSAPEVLLVMENVFPAGETFPKQATKDVSQVVDESYDLKGSYTARNADPLKPGSSKKCMYCNEDMVGVPQVATRASTGTARQRVCSRTPTCE